MRTRTTSSLHKCLSISLHASAANPLTSQPESPSKPKNFKNTNNARSRSCEWSSKTSHSTCMNKPTISSKAYARRLQPVKWRRQSGSSSSTRIGLSRRPIKCSTTSNEGRRRKRSSLLLSTWMILRRSAKERSSPSTEMTFSKTNRGKIASASLRRLIEKYLAKISCENSIWALSWSGHEIFVYTVDFFLFRFLSYLMVL